MDTCQFTRIKSKLKLFLDKLQGNVTRKSTRKWAQETNYDPEKIFNKLFCDDIKYLLSMSELWKKRTPPTPLRYGEFDDDVTECTERLELNGNSLSQKLWTLRECQSAFATSLDALQTEFSKLAIDDHLVWDKDDKAAMDFVAACANVRAIIFHIPQKSRFDIKCKCFVKKKKRKKQMRVSYSIILNGRTLFFRLCY